MSVRCHYYFPQQSWNSNMNMSVERSQSFQSWEEKKNSISQDFICKKNHSITQKMAMLCLDIAKIQE